MRQEATLLTGSASNSNVASGSPMPRRCRALRGAPEPNRAGEAGIGERLRSDEVLRETTKLLPAPPTCRPQVRGSLGFSNPRLKRGFGVARAPSPDVRGGHPCPPLSPRRYRFRPPGCAHRRGRLSEHGRPLAGGVTRRAFRERVGEAGIGERLRSDEVLRETMKLLPAPPTDHPQALSHPAPH